MVSWLPGGNVMVEGPDRAQLLAPMAVRKQREKEGAWDVDAPFLVMPSVT